MNKIITRSSKSIVTTTKNTIVPEIIKTVKSENTITNTIRNTITESNSNTITNTIKQEGEWENLNLLSNKLDLRKTLFSGQSFIWKEKEQYEQQEQEYIGVINEFVVILKYKADSNNDIIQYKFIDSKNNVNNGGTTGESKRLEILKDYFNLGQDINQLFSVWRNDSFKPTDKQPQLHSLNKQFRETCDRFIGLRLIRQNPLDCLFSFICSQNNNIGRITKMVNSLTSVYGDKITEYNGISFHKFPTLSQLSKVTESELNDLGFGYRSKFIVTSCNQVIEKGGLQWLMELRNKSHDIAQKELSTLMGVGPKVSDCVSLFSLDKFNVVPIDTHVFEISKKHIPSLSKKSLTPKLYKEIRDFWENIFGNHSGWAHSILFANEISIFKDKSTTKPTNTTKASKRKSTDSKDDDDNLNKKKK